jgi:hypothetical protein
MCMTHGFKLSPGLDLLNDDSLQLTLRIFFRIINKFLHRFILNVHLSILRFHS